MFIHLIRIHVNRNGSRTPKFNSALKRRVWVLRIVSASCQVFVSAQEIKSSSMTISLSISGRVCRSSDRNRMMFKRESVIIINGHSRLSGSVIKAK